MEERTVRTMRKEVWDDARLEYISTDCSQRDICEKYKISQTAVASRAKKEDWLKQRAQFKRKMDAKIASEMAKKKVKKLTQLTAVSDNLAKIVNKKTKAILRQISEAEKQDKNSPLAFVDPKDIRSLCGAAKDLTDVIRDVNNIPKDKLENEVVIVMDPALEAYGN